MMLRASKIRITHCRSLFPSPFYARRLHPFLYRQIRASWMVYGVSLEMRISEQVKQRKQRATTNPIEHDENDASISSMLQ
jgi:hypothetical protein